MRPMSPSRERRQEPSHERRSEPSRTRHASRRERRPSRRGIGIAALVAIVAVVALGAVLIVLFISQQAPSDDADTTQDDEVLDETVDAEIITEDAPEIVTDTTDSGITYTGYDTFADSEALANLEAVIDECEANGNTISIYVCDLDGGQTALEYNADATVYSASAIKGPYCIFVYQDLVETGHVSHESVSDLVDDIINYSDNDCYDALRTATIGMGWSDWLSAAGVDVAGRESSFDYRWYANMSAREFGAAWAYGYDYLTSGTEYADELATLFETTVHSPIHEVLQPTYKVWSKAGWFNTIEGNASYAMNDAGIVFSDTGPYVIAVCTDTNCDFQLVGRAVDAINQCHGELSGGSTESLLTEEAIQRIAEGA
jgi:hypothetical protein